MVAIRDVMVDSWVRDMDGTQERSPAASFASRPESGKTFI